jgi:peptidoglycan hydrolase-like protein with peptidoglycan-binding domain
MQQDVTPIPPCESAVTLLAMVLRQRTFLPIVALLFALFVIGRFPTTADAWAQAAWHNLGEGDKGADVTVLQYLLRSGGATTVTADGNFGPATTSAVKLRQQTTGLAQTGIVDAATWAKIVPTIKQGATGDSVRALQSALRAKHAPSLAVTGTFDLALTNSLKAFQTFAQLTADGTAGPTTWTNLVWRFVNPTFANGLCDVNEGMTDSWGTAATVSRLEQVGKNLATEGKKLAVNDMSLELGGAFSPHDSHRIGLDADVRPIRVDGGQCSTGCAYNQTCYDRAATRRVIDLAKASGRVKVIWFNDPQLITAYPNFVKQATGHNDHLHIRYCEPSHADVSYRC